MSEHILIGRTINQLQIADDRLALRFDTDQGEVIAKCDGECCSHTWIEHVEMPALGFPATVQAVRGLELGVTPDSEHGLDVTELYGCQIITDRGEIVIDYRNSSNGYYGGNLYWPGDRCGFDGGVFSQNVSEEQWRDIGVE